jgi:DDE superfamily endonuclease
VEKRGCTSALAAVGLTTASRVGFTDELRVGLRGTTRRVWGRRGIKVRQRRQLRYEWRYLVLAVDARAGTIWWGWADTMQAVDLWPLVAGLRGMDALDALVWDRAPGHRDADVRAVGLPPVELPPYSPELNPAERLFEEIRRRIEGKVYMTLAEKIAEVAAFLEEPDADPARVRRLCGWDWIEAAVEALPAPEQKVA